VSGTPLATLDRIACTAMELVVLAGLRNGTAVVGIHDPARGLADGDLDRALRTARQGLEQRGYLRSATDGDIILDADVADLVDVVVHAERSYFSYYVAASAHDAIQHGARRVWHTRGATAVEVVDNDTEVRVLRLGGRTRIADALLADWGIGQQPAAGMERAVLAQTDLRAAASAAAEHGRQASMDVLLAGGLRAAVAFELARTLTAPRGNAALIAFTLDRPGQTIGLGMLEGENGLWWLRPRDGQTEPLIELEPCTGRGVARRVRTFLERGVGQKSDPI
jgi:hypothetical protein